MNEKNALNNSIEGCILGTAVGDSLGLPVEFLKPSRIPYFLGTELKQNFFLGKGFVSDDTDHACFVAQALCKHFKNPVEFQNQLSWYLRLWLISLPAGIGLATLKSTFKLWLGFSPSNSGVFSAGNGPAMRSPLLGVIYGEDQDLLKDFVKRSTELTHSDPKAFQGALIVALAAYKSSINSNCSGPEFLEEIFLLCPDLDGEFREILTRAVYSSEKNLSLLSFCESEGFKNGVSGYIVHSVCSIIHVWLRKRKQFASAIEEIIFVGGDTDSTAAILGAIIGAGSGKESIPRQWLENLAEWPRNVLFMENLSNSLAMAIESKETRDAPKALWLFSLLRNLIFIGIIIPKALRRLFPPY